MNQMKMNLRMMFALAAVLVAGSAMATVSLNERSGISDPGHHAVQPLDEQCIIDFVGFTYGSYSGNMTWPGGSGTYRQAMMCFDNSCTPGEPFCTYCVDLDHALMADPYCVDINSVVVNLLYPDQYPAMAYVMTNYTVSNDAEDRLMQLSLWKLTNDYRVGNPNYGIPFVYTDAGRGWPLVTDPPAYPYVNTVYNDDLVQNATANDRVRDALGFPDGLPKNVIMCGDLIELEVGEVTIDGGFASVTVTVHITRGAQAIAVNNLETSGIKFHLSVSGVGEYDLHTTATGTYEANITVPVGGPDLAIQVCSRGVWPKEVLPCVGENGQRLLVQQLQAAAEACTLCTSVIIPSDELLSVELASFSAVGGTNGIDLNWRTASEVNASRWEIERRESDREVFGVVAYLPAQNSQGGANYHFLDRSAVAGVNYNYRLVDIDLSGARTVHEDRVVTAAMPTGSVVAEGYELADNFPNPFNPETSIRFTLADRAMANLTVYDLTGNAVAQLVNRTMDAGTYSVTFNAAALPSGTYFYKLVTPGFTSTKKMVLMK
jgi:hypothetical protein